MTTEEIKKTLHTYLPFLEETEIDTFLSICTYHFKPNKQVILKGGRYEKHLIFIIKGVTRAYIIDDNGNEINHYIRAEGHLMGDAKAFSDEIQQLTVESIGEVHYLKLDITKLESLGYENPAMLKLYHSFLKEIILTLAYRLHTFVTMTPEQRYLDLIKWNPILIETTFDKHLASFLGITPLTIHRIKKKQKLIK